jgi:hypothetical protein
VEHKQEAEPLATIFTVAQEPVILGLLVKVGIPKQHHQMLVLVVVVAVTMAAALVELLETVDAAMVAVEVHHSFQAIQDVMPLM